MTVYKDITVPFNISQMENLGDIDKNIYIINYDKSSIKGVEIIDYLTVLSKVCDLSNYENIDTETKFKMMQRLYHQPEFIFLPCMGRALSLILLVSKNIDVSDDEYKNSFLTKEEISQYILQYNGDIKLYREFFDSLWVFMMMLSKLIIKQKDIEEKDIDELYVDVKEDDCSLISPAICNVLFDDVFFKYYEKDIDVENIKYYKKFYTQRLFNGKTIVPVLVNEANFVIRKLIYLLDKVNNEVKS